MHICLADFPTFFMVSFFLEKIEKKFFKKNIYFNGKNQRQKSSLRHSNKGKFGMKAKDIANLFGISKYIGPLKQEKDKQN